MRSNRVYIDEPLTPESLATVGGSAANHIARVLRLRAGDALVAFDGRGGEYEARIDGIRKDTVLLAVGAHRAIERESPLAVTLAQGVSRGERMDFVVQKATELGVRRIVPLVTERSVVRLDAKQADAKVRHWRAVAIAACEQCGRNALPAIDAPMSLPAFLSTGSSARQDAVRMVLSPQGGRSVRDLRPAASLLILIGPEGGLSDAELDSSRYAGFESIRLGPRVLRTETAAIAALTAVQLRLGDL